MRYNTLVCDIAEIQSQSNGDFLLKGVVNHVVGEDYIPDQMISVFVKGNKEDYLDGNGAGTFMLEKVDPETGYCGFPTRIQEGKTAEPALIGPLQVSWTDNAHKYQSVTLDKLGLEGDALDKINRVSKQFAGSMRVSRNIIRMDDDQVIPGTRMAPNAQWQRVVSEMIEDDPNMSSIIIRDGQRSAMVRLGWEKETQQHVLIPPIYNGNPMTFKGEQIEIIPVHQMDYLTNRFNPKKSTAVAEINNQLSKSERQLAFDAKLFPAWTHFASGVVVMRNLPKGGHTLERIAASFPTQPFKSIPGELRIMEKKPDQVNAIDALKDLMNSLNIPKEAAERLLQSIPTNTPTHAAESENGSDPRPGLPKESFIDKTQRAAHQAQAVLQRDSAAAQASKPAAEPVKASEPDKATPPTARTPAPQKAEPVAPEAQDAPPPPRVSFGRRR